MSKPIDVAIVGAGAAGIAAARRLRERGHSVLLIESLSRLGGRARTEVFQGLPLDLGCGWLHSARRNPLLALAQSQAQMIDRSEGAWHRQLRDIHFPAPAQRQAWSALREFGARLRAAPPPSDRAADAVRSDDRWRPFMDSISSFMNGTELDQLSVADYLAYDDAATDDNWRLPGGYGAFIAGLGAGLPAALETSVESIAYRDEVVLTTTRGTLRARAVIVAVSTAVLAQGTIHFLPAVDDHLQAACRLPLGLADKVFLAVAEPQALPSESHLLGHFERAATGSYYMRPFGRPVIECYLGGSCAKSLEQAGTPAAFAFAIDELRELLGADFARGLSPITATRWAQEPSIRGSYSHALPGHAAARSVLASPVSERLCFAGEACSPADFSTAHGAWQSGVLAADSIEHYLARTPG